MAREVTRLAQVRWLEANGFVAKPGRASGLKKYTHADKGITITVKAHGAKDITKKDLANFLRVLAKGGFDKAAVRHELEGGKS